jgi:hypothetical protein
MFYIRKLQLTKEAQILDCFLNAYVKDKQQMIVGCCGYFDESLGVLAPKVGNA